MFTGIIESYGVIADIIPNQANIDFWITSPIASELKIDQSVAHDGVCLTVVAVTENTYKVTAIAETLSLTALHAWKRGTHVNLERAMAAGQRLDGHFVQGHTDGMGECIHVADQHGSWQFTFRIPQQQAHLLISKGSVCINGVSLTVVQPTTDSFAVAIIPYTYEHTNFNKITVGTKVNIEYDVIGKYLARYRELNLS
ncbi:MAG: riboflavin synthase [Saprospiraceae bacterium]|nr:riboflavin synthase [Saprospiraceae bacterium]MBP7699672.1 riboflavin synthase [Saprospiraceae bacterium]